MKIEIDIPKHQYKNIMDLDSISLGRAPYKGIIMYAINAIKRGKALEQEPVIDKIRAEIKAASLGKWYVGRTDGKAEEVLLMADVLQILDKYKAESEET